MTSERPCPGCGGPRPRERVEVRGQSLFHCGRCNTAFEGGEWEYAQMRPIREEWQARAKRLARQDGQR